MLLKWTKELAMPVVYSVALLLVVDAQRNAEKRIKAEMGRLRADTSDTLDSVVKTEKATGDEMNYISKTLTRALTLQKTNSEILLDLDGRVRWCEGRIVANVSPPTQASHYTPSETSVIARIRAAAEAKWPGDYNMQEYEIKKQTESWKRLNGR